MSSITQLSILNKDTDAYATERGYEYQKLKTLESWLQNSVQKSDEIIYYDYEEDIFQRDLTKLKSTFRQIKLYSSNFSFGSEEISKALSHFFTLYCAGDYLLDEVKFVFEANSNIARQHTNNKAELLREWYDNQDDLKEPLLSKCIAITKNIVTEFVNTHDDAILEIANAKAVFEELKSNSDFWEKFTKSISWNFQGVEPEEAMANSLKEIESLVKQLPYPIKVNNIESIVHSLHFHISQCATKENPEERLLDSGMLESKILSAIGGSEKWYGEQLHKWQSSEEKEVFRLGRLNELIGVARFYRQHQNLDGHREFWSTKLMRFLELADLPDFSKKDIIYELVFQKLRPTLDFKFHNPETMGIEDLVIQYFEIVPGKVSDPLTMEETVNLFSIVRAADAFGLLDLETEKYEVWLNEIENNIISSLETVKVNARCEYLESLSVIEFNLKDWGKDDRLQRFENGIKFLKDILELSEQAEQYNYSNLLIRVNEYIKTCFKLGIADEHHEIIDELESISADLAVIVSKREGDYSLAVQFSNRGINYLNHSKKPKDLLRALDYFHKSKNFLFRNETKDGFVLVLLNICQVYKAIGFNFAAKYYALAVFFYSMYFEELFKKSVISSRFVFEIDYECGSWIHCILDFKRFIISTDEFDPNWDLDSNITLRNVLIKYAHILYTVPKLVPDLDWLIQQRLNALGWIKEEHIDIFIQILSEDFGSKEELIKLTKSKLKDYPLNDIGEERIIQFRSFNILWRVSFPNTYEFNSIGEEFCAICQICFADIKTFYPDFDLKGEIQATDIQLVISDNPKPPSLIRASPNAYVWEVYLSRTPKPFPNYPSLLGCIMSVLRGFKVESDEYFSAMLKDLIDVKELGWKTAIIQAYEELYRSLYLEKEFVKIKSHELAPLKFDEDFVRKNITDD
ncbi:dsDNA nuclease domain-containing protein [Winogradskyella tangerina]|uniref:dsDNA nuclease domain-containing protein n=1 Tax=Winogradskyella tangerina TaxID=2023240 RepID=UPI000DBE134B|nr:hypothetical protein [Winogradskyella tangerina]